MTKVSIQKVMLGLLGLSLIATDAFGNMLPPVPFTQTNVNVRYTQQVAVPRPMPLPQPMPLPMGGPVPNGPQPMGQHGMYNQTNVNIRIRAQGQPCGQPCGQQGCGPRRQCAPQGHCRARIRSCGRMVGCGSRVNVRVSIRIGGGGGCFGRSRRC